LARLKNQKNPEFFGFYPENLLILKILIQTKKKGKKKCPKI